MSWSDVLPEFADPQKRWMLITGSHAGASSGIPLPFQRTPWSPSIAELVRYEIYRSQSRELARSVEKALEEGKAPLGFIADQLDKQLEWLRQYTDNVSPQKSLLRLADLIRSGMFSEIVSVASDDLLERAMDMLGVEYQSLSLEQPHREPDQLALYKAWDDRVFEDQEDRRKREDAYLNVQLQASLAHIDAVLLFGHPPHASPLVKDLARICLQKPDLELYWIDETYADPHSIMKAHGPPFHEYFAKTHLSFRRLEVEDAGELFDDIARVRGVEPTALLEPPAEDGGRLAHLLNRSFDIKPILVFVPGMALFGKMLNNMPKVSLRTLLSLGALVALILCLLNVREFSHHDSRLEPIRGQWAQARAAFRSAKTSKKNRSSWLLKAEQALDRAQAEAQKYRLATTKKAVFAHPMLYTWLERRAEALKQKLRRFRGDQLLPALYQYRLQNELSADPLLQRMGHFPMGDVSVSIQKPENKAKRLSPNELNDLLAWMVRVNKRRRARRRPLVNSRPQTRPLREHQQQQHIALFARSSTLLQVVLRNQMRKDVQAGRMAVAIDLEKARQGGLHSYALRELRRVTGYQGDKAPLFEASGLLRKMEKGAVSFYLFHLDTAGSVSKNLERINGLLERFPKSKVMLATYQPGTFRRLRTKASRFHRLRLQPYPKSLARRFLRARTSPRFFRGVMDNTYLRRNLTRPLIMSLLVDYYRGVGKAPRNIGVIYDRLLRSMLDLRRFGLPVQLEALGAVALEMLQKPGQKMRLERATVLIARHGKLPLPQATALLRSLSHRGILRFLDLAHVDFVGRNLKYLCASYALQKLPIARQARFLQTQSQSLIPLFAGLQPQMTGIVSRWLAEYLRFDAQLRKQKRHLTWVNPYLFVLKRAALAANNGRVSLALRQRLGRILLELLSHKRHGMMRMVIDWGLIHLSTPSIKQHILAGIESDSPRDTRLIRLAYMSASEVYVGALRRWMRRVAGPRDRQLRRRGLFKRARTKRGKPSRRLRRLQRRVRRAYVRGLLHLASQGTPEAVEIVRQHLLQRSSRRFARHWRYIRKYAAYALLTRGHLSVALPTLRELLKKPHREIWLIHNIRRINHPAISELLVGVVTQPTAYKRLRSLNVRIAKVRAVQSMTKLDPQLTRPLLLQYLASRPKGPDYRPLAAQVLGHIGNPKDFAVVAGLMRQWLKRPWPPTKKRRRWMLGKLNEAVALFGSRQAYGLFEKLRKDATWRKYALEESLNEYYTYIHLPETERYFAGQILCPKRSSFGPFLLLRLALKRSATARAHLRQLMELRLGWSSRAYTKRICGKARLAPIRRRFGLGHALIALSEAGESSDLARFARWASHPKATVRRAALMVLGRHRSEEASELLRNTLKGWTAPGAKIHPKSVLQLITALGKQRRPHNEGLLLQQLQGTKATPKRRSLDLQARKTRTLLRALSKSGGFASLLRAQPFQDDPLLYRAATRAIYNIARRTQGKGWSPQTLLQVAQGRKIAAFSSAGAW